MESPDFAPQALTALRFEHMKQALLHSPDPQATYLGYSLSGRDLPECILISILLLRLWNKRREQMRLDGQPLPPVVDDGPVHDAIFTRHADQVPECFTSFFADMVNLSQGFDQLNDVQRRLVGPAPQRQYPQERHLLLVGLVGSEERARECELHCAIAPAPVEFARLLVNLATGPNPPFQLEDTLEEKTYEAFDYCLNPDARSTPNNVRHCIEKVCLQRGLTPPKKRHRAGKNEK